MYLKLQLKNNIIIYTLNAHCIKKKERKRKKEREEE